MELHRACAIRISLGRDYAYVPRPDNRRKWKSSSKADEQILQLRRSRRQRSDALGRSKCICSEQRRRVYANSFLLRRRMGYSHSRIVFVRPVHKGIRDTAKKIRPGMVQQIRRIHRRGYISGKPHSGRPRRR